MSRVLTLPALLLAGFSWSAVAAPVAAQADSGLMGQMFQLGIGLVVVLGLIFMLGYLLRRVGPMAPQGGQHIRILSSYPLGPRDRLALVDVGGQQLLLGISAGRISTLHAFDEPVVSEGDVVSSDFSRKLQALLKREAKP